MVSFYNRLYRFHHHIDDFYSQNALLSPIVISITEYLGRNLLFLASESHKWGPQEDININVSLTHSNSRFFPISNFSRGKKELYRIWSIQTFAHVVILSINALLKLTLYFTTSKKYLANLI